LLFVLLYQSLTKLTIENVLFQQKHCNNWCLKSFEGYGIATRV
jgi:hypothetical protein